MQNLVCMECVCMCAFTHACVCVYTFLYAHGGQREGLLMNLELGCCSANPSMFPLHASQCWGHGYAHGHTWLFTGAPGTWPPGLMLVQYMSLLQSHLLGPEEVNFSDKVMQSLFSDVKYCSFVLCMSFSKGFLSMFCFQPQRSGPTF